MPCGVFTLVCPELCPLPLGLAVTIFTDRFARGFGATCMDMDVLLVTRSPEVHVHGLFEVHKGPWFPSRNRGEWRWLRLVVVHVPSFHVVHQTLSLCVPVQVCIVEGAPGHNRWGVAETPLPAKSQGRTRDCTF